MCNMYVEHGKNTWQFGYIGSQADMTILKLEHRLNGRKYHFIILVYMPCHVTEYALFLCPCIKPLTIQIYLQKIFAFHTQ